MKKTFGFCEWKVHSLNKNLSGYEWGLHSYEEDEVGAPLWAGRTP